VTPGRGRLIAAAVACGIALAAVGAASASAQAGGNVTATRVADRSCVEGLRSDAAVAARAVTAPRLSLVTARLDAGGGDWDLAVVDRDSGRVVAGSTSFGSDEVAQGFAGGGEELVVQACRRSGSDATATLAVGFTPVPRNGGSPPQLVKVLTPDPASETRLRELGLDLAEHAGDGYIAAVLHSPADRAALRAAGLRYEVQIADLAATSAAQARSDRRYAARVGRSSLPSGRDTYRRLFDYTEELKELAEQNPDLVRPFTLALKTWEGRTVEGIEITTNPDRLGDGKPIFLQMGLHHAREWPSGEHSIEWAYELINGYRAGDPELKQLVESTRTIVVPVVNPDGFNMSREAGEALGHGGGQSGDDILNFVASPNEYRRKNCRLADDSQAGNCLQPSLGLAEPGVDPNRNYGGFWGGPGASTDPTAQDYRGPGPFSEPETENIRRLISERQVVTLITNHTFSNLVLRPPGVASQGNSVDEPLYKAFGDAMAAENGYLSQHGYELYDTTGTTEDWSYYTTGGLGFTFEIGCNPVDPAVPSGECIGNFHPPFAQMVAEYEGTSPAADAVGGHGNQAAYLIAQRSTANPERHAVLEGKAPPGATLRIEKTVQTPTSPQPSEGGEPILLEDRLSSELEISNSGEYEWHINPSTRPLVAQEYGRPALGAPSASIPFSGGPGPDAAPCANFDTDDPACWNDHPFTVPGGDGVDNESATVAIEWATPASDWDMKVFRDIDGDDTSINETAADEVGQSAQGTTAVESATFVEPELPDGRLAPGEYVIRVINFAAGEPYTGEVSFEGPDEFQAARSESWTLTCSIGGTVGTTQPVTIARGERQTINLRQACLRGTDVRCAGKPATMIGTGTGETLRGTKRADVIVAKGGADRILGRGRGDRICAGGGSDRVGSGKGADTVEAARGRDRIGGGSGADTLGGAKGADRIRGAGGRDTLSGGKGRDRLAGGKGSDRLRGGKGRDRCAGGAGANKLRSC
jgi:Zinc carboxypeptidase/RTX calcium-binding nonapeptide repeat (4 copies)